ncbi:hypothetical protein ACFQ21_00535 [Ohtaekwangia kribbensis]|jgi:hypothetical protein|uniref:Uncharacterized protein n=1 Tax=Ohtaekwangia kribbensis TaxID=688913 RepID=A0ABW3JW67_9BACT
MKIYKKFWFQWVMNYSIGELMGIAAAAAIGRIMFMNLSNDNGDYTSLFPFTILLIAGAAEGFIIGYTQWKSISLLVTNFKPVAWILTTTIAVIVGWLSILPPSVVFIAFLSSFDLIGDYHSMLYTGLAGLAFGGIISTPQFFIIRKHYRHAETWIMANAIGWMLSFMVLYAALSVFTHTTSFIFNVLVIILSCIVSGAIQGIITGTFLHLVMVTKTDAGKMNETVLGKV